MTFLDFHGRQVVSDSRPRRSSHIQRRTRPNNFDRSVILDLLTAVNRQKKWPRQTINAEADHIRLLRTTDKRQLEEIETIMLFHVTMLRETYHPKAFGGAAFRRKYFRIKARFEELYPPEENIVATKEAIDIHQRLSRLDWPKQSKKKLLTEIQLSLDWIKRVRMLITAEQASQREYADTLRNLAYAKLLSEVNARWVEQYYRDLSSKLLSWDNWNGDLRKFRMSGDQTVVWSKIQKTLEQYAGVKGTRYADALKDSISET